MTQVNGHFHNQSITRFSTAGDVDNGKSTLIGRLLMDQGAVSLDQLEALAGTKLGENPKINLAHITDGLKEERELGITIDVAYRYFSRQGRDFIVADTPGHKEFTRNMFTGTSTSDAAVILVDAQKGVVEQNRRHLFISSLLNTPHVFICINKMDLVNFSADRYHELRRELETALAKLHLHHVEFIPIAALHGDNVVDTSLHMPWYNGGTLLQHLEQTGQKSPELKDFRFLVQLVRKVRHHDGSGIELLGQVAAGEVSKGETIKILSQNRTTEVQHIRGLDGALNTTFSPKTAGLIVEDATSIKRGDILVHATAQIQPQRNFKATLCWMDDAPLESTTTYLLKAGPQLVPASIGRIYHTLDIADYSAVESEKGVQLNDIASVEIETQSPLCLDSYRISRKTGSFILIDPISRRTVAAGVVDQTTSG